MKDYKLKQRNLRASHTLCSLLWIDEAKAKDEVKKTNEKFASVFTWFVVETWVQNKVHFWSGVVFGIRTHFKGDVS